MVWWIIHVNTLHVVRSLFALHGVKKYRNETHAQYG